MIARSKWLTLFLALLTGTVVIVTGILVWPLGVEQYYIRMLGSKDGIIQSEAAAKLGEVGGCASLNRLLSELADAAGSLSSPVVYHCNRGWQARAGIPMVKNIRLERLRSAQPFMVYYESLLSIVSRENGRCVSQLVMALEDERPVVKFVALDLLAAIGPDARNAEKRIEEVVYDPNGEVAVKAFAALSVITGKGLEEPFY